MNKNNVEAFFQWGLIYAFIILVTLPLIGFFLPKIEAQGSSLDEKRALNPFPEFNLSKDYFNSFPKSYEGYFNDHFGFRDTLIRAYNYIHVKILGVSPVQGAVIGKNGWLFWTGFNIVNDYRGKLKYSLSQLIKIKDILEARTKWLKQKGIPYFFVVAPNKWMIYPEFLPARHNEKSKDVTRFEQLKKFLTSAQAEVKIVDLKDDLLKARNISPLLYYKTDSHWNQLGAFISYKQLMREIIPTLDGIPFKDDSEFRMVTMGRDGGDIAILMGASRWYYEENTDVMVRRPCASQQPFVFDGADKYNLKYGTQKYECPEEKRTALIFRDSYFSLLRPYFSEHFKESYYIWTRYNQEIVKELMESIRPDIIIDETVDRFLTRTDDENKLFLTDELLQQSYNDSKAIILKIDPDNEYQTLRPHNDIVMKNSKETYLFEATGTDSQLTFSNLSLSLNQSAVLLIEFKAPSATSAIVYYKTKEKPQYDESNTLSANVQKGENRLFFYLNGMNLIGDIRFDPGVKTGQYEIRSIEARLLSNISNSINIW